MMKTTLNYPDVTLNPGETTLLMCDTCGTEFELTFEPKARDGCDHLDSEPETVGHCPFCGSDCVAIV